MAKKVAKLSVVGTETARDDIDAMLAMATVEADADQDEVLAEFEAEFAAAEDQGEPPAPRFAGANQWPVSRAEHRLIERITHRKGSRPISIDALKSKLDYKLDNRGNTIGFNPTAYNATMVLQNDPRTHGALELDLFTGNVRVSRTVRLKTTGVANLHARPEGENYWDDHESVLMTWLGAPDAEGGWGLVMGSDRMGQAVRNAAYKNARHPIYEVITSKPWDGVKRMDSAFERYLKLDPKNRAYNHQASRLFFVAAVTRLFEPGHKFDHMPVIQGLKQGSGKSSTVEALALGYFGELMDPRELNDTKLLNEITSGKWIIEFTELNALMGLSSTQVKSKLSSKKDKARAAYSKYVEERERSWVPIGTVQVKQYLHDPTGNRRFWPLSVGVTDKDPVDLDLIRSEIQQVYAEALATYRQMRVEQPDGDLKLCLTGEADEIAARLQSEAAVETPETTIAGWIQDWLVRPAAPDDAEHADLVIDGERYVTKFCSQQAFEAYHRAMGNERVPDYDTKAQRLMGTAIQLVPGVTEGNKRQFHKFGRQRTFYVDQERTVAEVNERNQARKAHEQAARTSKDSKPAKPWQDAAMAQIAKEHQDTVAELKKQGITELPKADVTPVSHGDPKAPAAVCLVHLPRFSDNHSLFDGDNVDF